MESEHEFVYISLGYDKVFVMRARAWFYKTPMPSKFTGRVQLYHYLLHSLLTPNLLLTLAD